MRDDRLDVLTSRMCTSHYWVKTPDGPRHVKRALTDKDIQAHLDGTGPAIGLCPITPGESTCQVGCIDIDDHARLVSIEVIHTAVERVRTFVPSAIMFTSSSGHGAHLYLVWDEPQDAHSVRAWLTHAVQSAGYKEGTKGIAAGEVELFPKQDSVSMDKWGSMFILPYSGKSTYMGDANDLTDDIWYDTPPVPIVKKETAALSAREVVGPSEGSSYVDALSATLASIPNSGEDSLSYDEWRNVIFGIHDATQGSDEGLQLAHAFSSKSNKYDADFLSNRVWPYVDDHRHPKVTAATIEAIARRYKAVAEFEDLTRGNPNQNAFVVPWSAFREGLKNPEYIWHHVLQKGCLYALTAPWGHGKTALMVTVALHAASGRPLGGHKFVPDGCRVLYLCGENPDDVRLRFEAAAEQFDLDPVGLSERVYFTKRAFPLDDEKVLSAFLKECGKALGESGDGFDLVVIDTGPAHSSTQEENDNREMHALAMAMRRLMRGVGGSPAVVALMHPIKGADRDTLAPRGGGAFSGEVDGLLGAWQEEGAVELFHLTKFRGPGFASMWYRLMPAPLIGRVDNFGEPVLSVVAVEGSKPRVQEPARGKWQWHVLAAVGDLGEYSTVQNVIAGAMEFELPPESGRDQRLTMAKRAVDVLVQNGHLMLESGILCRKA